ncbi:mitochondrial transcription termination factor 3 [Rhynchophorus ferrugineus]|uniref:mitochondrial transcription termination factor 3 n=1 Tax=Rhynchophorus ferrugineus TaxID=354439 RepID=UPI003FCEBE5F
MLKQMLRFNVTKHSLSCFVSQLASLKEKYPDIDKNIEITDSLEVQRDQNKPSLLEPLTEDISHISSYLKPTYNVAAYANKSETIQQLVKLGVNIAAIEKKKPEAVTDILKLSFDDIKGHIIFFNQLGLDNSQISYLITNNPYIFRETLDNLDVRITYLKFKQFTNDMVSRIVGRNPFWLSYRTQEIDDKLGFFQKTFHLSGKEVRQIAVAQPKLITFDQEKIKVNIFALKEEMCFSPSDLKEILLKKPKLYMNGQRRLLDSFEYLHNTMKVSLEQIVENPEILTYRKKRLRERHLFLVKLGRDQFDSRKPNYVALTTMVKNDDGTFATEVAKSSVNMYNNFLKSL